jgi:hypothetical protein
MKEARRCASFGVVDVIVAAFATDIVAPVVFAPPAAAGLRADKQEAAER